VKSEAASRAKDRLIPSSDGPDLVRPSRFAIADAEPRSSLVPPVLTCSVVANMTSNLASVPKACPSAPARTANSALWSLPPDRLIHHSSGRC